MEKALSHAGLRDLWLTFSPAWLKNFVAACGLARSTATYSGLRRRLWGLGNSLHPSMIPCPISSHEHQATAGTSQTGARVLTAENPQIHLAEPVLKRQLLAPHPHSATGLSTLHEWLACVHIAECAIAEGAELSSRQSARTHASHLCSVDCPVGEGANSVVALIPVTSSAK